MEIPRSLWTACAEAHSLYRKKVFPDVQREGTFCVFCYCPLSLVPALGTTEKSLTLSSVYLPFRYLYLLVRFFLRLPCLRLNSSSSLSFFLLERCFSPLIIFTLLTGLSPVCPCLTCNEKSRTRCHSSGASPVLTRGEGSPSLTC